jgi:polyferredoxin
MSGIDSSPTTKRQTPYIEAAKHLAFVTVSILWMPIGIMLIILALVPVAMAFTCALGYAATGQSGRSALSIGILAGIVFVYGKAWRRLRSRPHWQEYRTDM